MRSLRARLIAGAALVAVVPLALSMFFLARQIESTVRREADARLGAAVGGFQDDLRADTARIAGTLRLLGEDPALKRLYLVGGGDRALSDYLAERRVLLRLDVLQVADMAGNVVADAAASLRAASADGTDDAAAPTGVRAPPGLSGLALVPTVGDSGVAVVLGAPIRYDRRRTGTVVGGRLVDAGYLERLKRVGGMELLLRDGAGRALARTRGAPDSVPAAIPGDAAVRTVAAGRAYLARTFPLALGDGESATVTGFVPTESADRTIAALRATSLLLGLLGLAIAVLLGSLWSAQVSRPVERLAAFSRDVARGAWDEPLDVESIGELDTLVQALETMRRDLAEYRRKLITSERQSAWSQMARRVAHEIKNPLTPIAVSIEDLHRSYEQRREDFPEILRQAVRTIAEEVATMKRLLQEFSDFARFPAPTIAPCRVRDLLDDVAALYPREVAAGRLTVAPPAADPVIDADGGQIRQVLVNLVKNALEAVDGAGASGTVSVAAEPSGPDLVFSVRDTGPGLSDSERANLFLPGFTTKAEGSGLGLTIVERIVNDHDGAITVESRVGTGTTIRVRLPRRARPSP